MSIKCYLAFAFGALTLLEATPADELGKRATWEPATYAQVKSAVDAWLAERQLDERAKLAVETLWPAEEASNADADLLDRVAATIAVVEQGDARTLVEFCRNKIAPRKAAPFEFLQDENASAFATNNLRLYYGRWLAQNEFYDEAVQQLSGLQAEDVVDPTALLFYQSVGFHRLMEKEKCLASLGKLLENESELPQRYAAVAQLMAADIQPLKPDTLDEITRLMDDIHRRQRLYRAGTRVRKQEEDVIAKLDKMIEELEEQQKKQSSSGGGNAPGQPMQDSQIGGGGGPGNVDQRQIGQDTDWGKMPPKDREAAMAELAKDLPAHYREVIEQYFRKLARDEPR